MKSNKKEKCSICKKVVSPFGRHISPLGTVCCDNCFDVILKDSGYRRKLILSSVFLSGLHKRHRCYSK